MAENYSIKGNVRFHGSKLLGLMALVVVVQSASSAALAGPVPEEHAIPAQRQTPAAKPAPGETSAMLESLLPASAPLGTGPREMLLYSPRKPVDLSSLVSFGSPEALGGQVLTGRPKLFGRIDFAQGNVTAGLFMATTGLIRVTFPFTEHATVVAGRVTLTDETGKTRTLKPGDSYVIQQGAVILWDVKGPYVIKSFFNITEP